LNNAEQIDIQELFTTIFNIFNSLCIVKTTDNIGFAEMPRTLIIPQSLQLSPHAAMLFCLTHVSM
jgi:hypothetical protein